MSDDLPDGATSVRLGAAILRPIKEKDHYGLFRPIILIRKDGEKITREQHQQELGPLAIYRRRMKGDPVPEPQGVPGMMKTHDPLTNMPLEVILVWRPTTNEMREVFKDE